MAPMTASKAAHHPGLHDASRVANVDDAPETLVQRANDGVSTTTTAGPRDAGLRAPIDLAWAQQATKASATDAPAGTAEGTGLAFTDHADGNRFAQVVSFPPPAEPWRPAATLHPVQEWEGYVVDIGDTDFTARLIDLTEGASYEEEEAVIPLIELSDNDRMKMQNGSFFRWVIGYERSPAGTRKRVSQIVFRDLPAVTESDRRAGQAWAREIMQAFR